MSAAALLLLAPSLGAAEPPASSSTGLLLTGVALAGALVVAGAVLLAGGRACRGPEDTWDVGILRFLVVTYARFMHGIRGAPRSVLPDAGPAIVVANHRSGVDPLVLAPFTNRVVHFMMAREYYELPILRFFFDRVGAIPVRRDGNDLAATKRALKVLHSGGIIGIFPEGGIRNHANAANGDGAEDPAKHGAALLALRTSTPVVPAFIHGTPPLDSVFLALLRPSRSRVVFGQAFLLECDHRGRPTREEIERATRRIMDAIASLREDSRAPTPA